VYSYKRIVEEYIKDHDVSAVDVAAALALLLHKDMPWRKELNMPKAASAFKEDRARAGEKGLDLRGRFKEDRKNSFADRKGARGSKKDFAKDFSNERKKFNDGRKAVNQESVAQDLFRIDVGKIHGVKPGNIVGAIANEAGLQSRYITGLKIHEDHSTVRLPKGMPKEVMKDLTKAWVCGRQLNLTLIGSA